MRLLRWMAPCLTVVVLVLPPAAPAAEPTYLRKKTRVETITATLKAAGLPNLQGKWHVIGPFENDDNKGFAAVYPPEKEIDLDATYSGKRGARVAWKPIAGFDVGKLVDLRLFRRNDNSCLYLYHEFESSEAVKLPISLGSDDGLKVWCNGRLVLEDDAVRGAAPDQNEATLPLKKGTNTLLIKVTNVGGEWSVYLRPEFPESWPADLRKRLERDFPRGGGSTKPASSLAAAEAKYYKAVTLPVPKDVVLEVGGLAVRPDGKLLACTRRGDVWLISHPNTDDPDKVTYKRFATGLHEALGLSLVGKDVYVVQRPELTKLVDRDGDDEADEYVTVCDKWGVSGDYHEFAFGPARDKDGNFYVTLNVGFGWGHQAKAPWRGWCVKITPKGDMVPFATGLRSPNGVSVSPDGDVFYCDNQGEWVATNKLHHVQAGDNYGHQAGLKWVKQSPFAKTLKESYPSEMLYDGQKGNAKKEGRPELTPPSIWFPYDRMGKSASEPRWDTTRGKFGPFAGQCFVGDQWSATVMRVYLEKVNGRFQGACFPFRSGLQCGVNRLAFAPDGNLYVGQTNRGWGSLGGKPYGLQRLVWTGVVPFEIHSMKLTKTGFDLTFTKALDDASARRIAAYSLQSFTYRYWSKYGCPEVDRKAEAVDGVKVSADRKTVSLAVKGFKPGRVYELHLDGVKSADGEAVLHPDAYYTLNELAK